MSEEKDTQSTNKIELTKTEFDELTLREGRMQDKINQINALRIDLKIHENEVVNFMNSLLSKQGLSGTWKRDGNFLVRMPTPPPPPSIKKDIQK